MKYLMLKKEISGVTHFLPIIFPNQLVHDEISELLRMHLNDEYTLHSAGFLTTMWKVYGESETLGVGSDPDDSIRLGMCDYGGCIE